MSYFNNHKFTLNNNIVEKKINTDLIKKSDTKTAEYKKNMLDTMKSKLNISSDYKIFFMNNVYEMYKSIIHSIIYTYIDIKKFPYILCNKMEDPILLEILKTYEDTKKAHIIFLKSNIYGTINTDEIETSIKKNKPCLIINSFINHFTGAINNIKKIGEMAHKYKIPLFSDCSYIFGRLPINPDKNNIDIFTLSMDYPDLNFIIIKNSLLEGYKLYKYIISFDYNIYKHITKEAYVYNLGTHILQNIYKARRTNNNRIIKLKNYMLKNMDYIYYDEFIKTKLILKDKSDNESMNNDKSEGNTKYIIFGHDINNENMEVPHIMSILVMKKKKYNGVKFCDIDTSIFDNIGINNKWKSNIIVLGFNDNTKKNDIDKLLKVLN